MGVEGQAKAISHSGGQPCYAVNVSSDKLACDLSFERRSNVEDLSQGAVLEPSRPMPGPNNHK